MSISGNLTLTQFHQNQSIEGFPSSLYSWEGRGDCPPPPNEVDGKEVIRPNRQGRQHNFVKGLGLQKIMTHVSTKSVSVNGEYT